MLRPACLLPHMGAWTAEGCALLCEVLGMEILGLDQNKISQSGKCGGFVPVTIAFKARGGSWEIMIGETDLGSSRMNIRYGFNPKDPPVVKGNMNR